MGMGGLFSGHTRKASFQVAQVCSGVTITASASSVRGTNKDRDVESFTATCTEFERRISGQKRDGRLIARPSPFDRLTEE